MFVEKTHVVGDDVGLRPKGYKVWWVISALALSFHLGLRPKTPRELLGYTQEKDVRQEVGPQRVCRGPSAYRKDL